MPRNLSRALAAGVFAFATPLLAVSPGTAADHGQYVEYDWQGAWTVGEAINNHGTIIGEWIDSSGAAHGFIRAADGTLTTFDPKESQYTFTAAINDKGAVAGSYQDQASNTYGFLRLPNGKVIRLGNEGIRVAHSINNQGDICGSLLSHQAFIRSADGTITEIDPPGAASSFAAALNDSGVVAGDFKDSAGQYHGFVRALDGTITTFDRPGSVDTYVRGMNANGVIVGYYTDPAGVWHPYIRGAAGDFTEIPLKGLSIDDVGPLSINRKGVVAGALNAGQHQRPLAFLRKPGGKITHLKWPDGAIIGVSGINDHGVIVGGFDTSLTGEHGYLRLP